MRLSRHLLNLRPLLISHERRPLLLHRFCVRPLEQIDQLCAVMVSRFPDCHNFEAVSRHDPHRMIAEPFVERRFITVEDLVDPQLVDDGLSLWHLCWRFVRVRHWCS